MLLPLTTLHVHRWSFTFNLDKSVRAAGELTHNHTSYPMVLLYTHVEHTWPRSQALSAWDQGQSIPGLGPRLSQPETKARAYLASVPGSLSLRPRPEHTWPRSQALSAWDQGQSIPGLVPRLSQPGTKARAYLASFPGSLSLGPRLEHTWPRSQALSAWDRGQSIPGLGPSLRPRLEHTWHPRGIQDKLPVTVAFGRVPSWQLLRVPPPTYTPLITHTLTGCTVYEFTLGEGVPNQCRLLNPLPTGLHWRSVFGLEFYFKFLLRTARGTCNTDMLLLKYRPEH